MRRPSAEALEGRRLLAASAAAFGPPAPIALPAVPNATALADFNGDGNLDVAFSLGGAIVGVAPGVGDGTFGAVQSFNAYPSSVPRVALSVTTGDFDGDGRPDIVVSNFSANTVSILRNVGTGGSLDFAAPVAYGAGAVPNVVAVGDFNSDGKLDLATANLAADPGASVGLLLGRGDGTFRSVRFVAAGENPGSLAVGDFNNDGALDLVASYGSPGADRVGVLMGNGDGTFQAVSYFGVGRAPTAIAVGDFDGDGRLDLATADYHGSRVSVLLGDGNGGFHGGGAYRVGRLPESIATADFTGDGKLDLVFSNSGSNCVSILIGRGNGRFAPNPRRPGFLVGGTPTGTIAVGRLNRDGLPDIVVPILGSRASVLVNRARPAPLLGQLWARRS